MGFSVVPLKAFVPAVLAGCLAASAILPAAAPAAIFAFDAELSLTGACTTSVQDPVPDPSCPGPPLPPSGSFNSTRAVATDSFGDIYVASYGKETGSGDGRIDIFNSSGEFLTEISGLIGPKAVAVDSKGYLYVYQHRSGVGAQLERYKPTVYKPEEGEIAYENAPVIVAGGLGSFVAALAINPLNDHLFARVKGTTEYASGEEENTVVGTIPERLEFLGLGAGLAIDATRGRLYLSVERFMTPEDPYLIQVSELAAPHNEIELIDGSDLPEGKFLREPALAVDEASGHIFTYYENDTEFDPVYELSEEGEFVAEINHEFKVAFSSGAQPTIDNSASSPNQGYLFVPSRAPSSAVGHSYAFGPREVCPPVVESASFANVAEEEAELRASIEPCGLDTDYSFEITTQQKFEEGGFAGATPLGGGQIAAGGTPIAVAAGPSGLNPGTEYRFRVVASNEVGEDEGEGAFATYPANPLAPCPNDPLRTGHSAALPDCRAYELVSPAQTNARSPIALNRSGPQFPTRESSPGGDRLSFQIGGGTIPGFEGTGSLGGDPYLVTRSPSGWKTAIAGPNGSEAPTLLPGSTSPDQGHLLWSTGSGQGSAAIGGQSTTYVRYPDGHFALLGRGSANQDPRAEGKLISEGATHIIYTSKARLEEEAPTGNVEAIYDRTPDEVTHVVSLLPGDVPPAAGKAAKYLAASLDGRGVAFEIDGTLYLRHDNEETYEIGSGLTFEGIAEGGGRIFYLQGGNLKAFDVEAGTISFTTVPNTVVVNVAAEGSAAYFASTSAVPGTENPLGQKPEAGQQNLYLSREGQISFVGVVSERDVEGEFVDTEMLEGLGLWAEALINGKPGKDPSRSSADGEVLLFESRADLTAYDSQGEVEVYRYDFAQNTLRCLSCNPTGAPAQGRASLMSVNSAEGFGSAIPLTSRVIVNNLVAGGDRAFFQSTEPLVAADTDELQDVYEWEEKGTGSCTRSGGCIYLISSGQSLRADFLYAVSDSGDDVFIRSADLLLGADREQTPSIYDARVGGGFAQAAPEAPCEGEGCRSGIIPAPGLASPAQPAPGAKDNVRRSCPKGKRKVRRKGKVRCAKKHKRRHAKHTRAPHKTRKGARR